MPEIILAIILGLLALAVGIGAGWWFRQRTMLDPSRTSQAVATASDELGREAVAQAAEIVRQAEEESVRLRATTESEEQGRRAEIQRQDQRLRQKEASLDRKLADLDRREQALQAGDQEIAAKDRQANDLRDAQVTELEQVSGLTVDEARELIVAQVEQGVRDVCRRRAREIEQEATESADFWARQIIGTAIQRYSDHQFSEPMVSMVPIPTEEMKARIVGREGRNIRALEAATGVEVIVDDTASAVTLTGSDPARREDARLALTKLVADGRANPARIDELVARAKHEVEARMRQEGETAAFEAGGTQPAPRAGENDGQDAIPDQLRPEPASALG